MKKIFNYSPYLLLIPFFFFIFKIYYARVSDFGCFDDCFNFMGGYFLVHGKQIYSQFFYNHQPLMAYISFLIQKFLHPSTLYTLILYHRLFALGFAFFFDILLIVHFRKIGVWFVVIYELTKYYLFGDRYLAEGFIVYPLVYIMGMIWTSWTQRKIYQFEIIISSILVLFVIFSREPYIPLTIFMYGLVLWQNRRTKASYISIILLFILSLVTVIHINLKDYFFNVFTLNQQTVGSKELFDNSIIGIGGLKIVGYPIWIILSNIWNNFRIVLLALDGVFLFSFLTLFFKQKIKKEVLFIFIILALANIRFVAPGEIFYASFHMLPWYGLFVFLTGALLFSLTKFNKKLGSIIGVIFICIFLFTIFSASYFVWDKIDRQKEFVTNFGEILSNGSVVKDLAFSSNTLFLDGHDDMIYWQAGLLSPYTYSWYTSVMPRFSIFTKARADMFRNSPPDFYYAYCPPNAPHSQQLPTNLIDSYQALYFAGQPSCLFIRKSVIPTVDTNKWEAIKNYGYYLSIDTKK